MAITTFAAIDIGSYEISMKIFEFSKKIGFRQLNDVRYRLEIGKGAYSSGRLEPDRPVFPTPELSYTGKIIAGQSN